MAAKSVKGVSHDEFVNACVVHFNQCFHDRWTIDELLLHPEAAIKFCCEFKSLYAIGRDKEYHEILRVILARRKSPKVTAGHVNVWHYKEKR